MVEIMRMFIRYRYQWLLCCIVLSPLINACDRSAEDSMESAVNNNPVRIQSLLDQAKIVCFGRFLMQVPATATVVYGPAEVMSAIDYVAGGASEIEHHASQRMEEVEKERRFFREEVDPELPLFGEIIKGVREGQKIVIGSRDRVGYAVDSFTPIQNDLFVQSFNSILPEEKPIDEINKVAEVLQLRNMEEIPVESGLCIDGGFVPGVYDYERVTIGIRLKEFPDVHLSIDAHKNLKYLRSGADPKLLHEQARARAEAEGLGPVFSSTRILRDQIRKIERWNGREMAFRTPAYKDAASVHEFRFHSVGVINDPFHPELDIRLDSGVKNNSKGGMIPSITDEEALALWDALITTIRIREPGDATPVKIVKLPLATHAVSGEKCPESGWWETTDKRIASGDRRKLLRIGNLMPHAATLAKTNFWHKLFGDERTKIGTTWKLVEYDDDIPKSATSRVADRVVKAAAIIGDKHA